MIITQKTGWFVRLSGIFGKTLKGTILFTEDAILITKDTKNAVAAVDEHTALDVLYYSDISDFTRSVKTGKDVRYQITTKDGKKCTLALDGETDVLIEELIGRETIVYKNLIEKKMGVETKDESALFAALHAKHIFGLPMAEGLDVDITANNERILFIHNAQEISLAATKIVDVSIKTDVEIQSSYVSSIGSAILGGYFFGTVGAVIGGQAREKRSTVKKHFLIITYVKDAEQAYLSFYVEDLQEANSIVAFYNADKATTKQRVDL